MTSHEDNNFQAFNEATTILRSRGYQVCSPSETDGWLGDMSHEDYLRFDFARVLEADIVVALDGWEQSVGALSEILMAVRMGVPVFKWRGDRLRWVIDIHEVEEAIGELRIDSG